MTVAQAFAWMLANYQEWNHPGDYLREALDVDADDVREEARPVAANLMQKVEELLGDDATPEQYVQLVHEAAEAAVLMGFAAGAYYSRTAR
jgi:hypothetical protein